MNIITQTLFILALLWLAYSLCAMVTIAFLNHKHGKGAFSAPWYIHAATIVALVYTSVFTFNLFH